MVFQISLYISTSGKSTIMKSSRVLISFLGSIAIVNSICSNSFSHYFYINQGSVLFTLVKQFQVEDNLESNTLIVINQFH